MSQFKNSYGYFSDDGKEYIITDYHTPKPWVNVLSNGHYGLVISQLNGGFSWLDNSNLNRITRWNQDLVGDNWGKYIYLRDDHSGEIWSPTVHPVRKELEYFKCRHGIGYTKFISEYKGIKSELRIFIPFNANLEIWSLKLINTGSQKRDISIFTYFEWLLGAAPDNHREFHKIFIENSFDVENQILTAKKRLWEVPAKMGHWNINWPYVAYFSCSEKIDGFESDKESFLGRYGSFAEPLAVKKGTLTGKQGKWNDAIASVHKKIHLPAKESITIHFLLGIEKNENAVKKSVQKFRSSATIEKAFRNVTNYWERHFNAAYVETPDQGLNLMTNIWLKYQTIVGRIWGRAAYYQQSGAYGFRDQLQDSQIFLYLDPSKTKDQILLHAAHQFNDGRALHWWHTLSEQGIDAKMSDDLLWLPFITIQYLKETADWDILKEKINFYDEPKSATLKEHCLRAINLVLNRFSKRGLPLILAGDWNDGLSALGLEGKGESVWLGHFLYYILREFEFILKKENQNDTARRFAHRADALKQAINEYGWDGEWYWRASKDSGKLIGSKQNKEGKIFLNAQTWAIIAGTADEMRQKALLETVVENLESAVGPLLFMPAYTKPDEEIGYLSRYAPGVRENGGVYTHAATWFIWAASILGKDDIAYSVYNKICPVKKFDRPDEYKAEPYVTSGNLDGPDSPFYGRGGWTWYTGSAAWLFRVTIDHIIGIQADYEGLRVKPNFPADWKNVKLKRLFRGKTFNIKIKTIKSATRNGLKIFMDNEPISGNLIPVLKGNKDVSVLIIRYNNIKKEM